MYHYHDNQTQAQFIMRQYISSFIYSKPLKMKCLFAFCIILFFSFDLFSQNNASHQIKDSIRTSENRSSKRNGMDASGDKEISAYIHLGTGIYTNQTFGPHPIINPQIGILCDKNIYILDYEQRFGPSKQEYHIIDNDTLKMTNTYNGECLGFAFEHTVYESEYQKLVFHSGLGYDWLTIPKGDVIHHSKTIGGLDINIGMGYSFYFGTRHGPSIMLIYHYSDMKNDRGSKISSSSLVCRLTYNFGHEVYKLNR